MEPSAKELKVYLDERGYLSEILRADESIFTKFGQLYLSTINPSTIKGFHIHRRKTDYITCVEGQVRFVAISEEGKVWEFHLSPLVPKLVTVPPGYWHGWRTIGTTPAILINVTTEPFNPNDKDEERMDPIDNIFGYQWDLKNG